jgi:uncharacterized protein
VHNDSIYIQQLKESLKELNPYLIMLLGSYAWGIPHKDSDIDLLVVTNDDFMPENYDEKLKLSLKVKRQIYEINKQVAIDLIVYTKPMYQRFIELQSSFSHEILSKGIILYENNYDAMA